MSRGRPRERGWPPAPDPLAVPVVDNHTHLDGIAQYVPAEIGHPTVHQALDAATAVGVTRVVQVGCDLDAARLTASWVDEEPRMVGAVAIHPNEALLHGGVRGEVGPDGLTPEVLPRHSVSYEDAFAEIARLARTTPRIRAIGETGLDKFRSGPRGFDWQVRAFRDHIALAKELDLPMQIHDRDAHADVVRVLLADGPPARTVFHCFSGDSQLAETCVQHGWFVSVAGPVTFVSNDELRAAVRLVPRELLQVETDAPFLTPRPWRGRPNAPYLLPETVRQLAQVRDEDLDTLCAALSQTAEALYGPWFG